MSDILTLLKLVLFFENFFPVACFDQIYCFSNTFPIPPPMFLTLFLSRFSLHQMLVVHPFKLYVCVFLWECAWEWRFPQSPGMSVRCPGARVIVSCEPSEVGPRNRIWVLWKASALNYWTSLPQDCQYFFQTYWVHLVLYILV